jgi:DNA-directed RNA polymerase subunit beta'
MSEGAVTVKKYTENNYNELNFESIKIGLASPDTIRGWSYGEVTKPETINYRTLKPEKDGLFCERIFGPTKDWECHCGKYKRIRYKGKICERCGVKITKSKVRRERMGHIELACPVSHIWYFKGTPSRIALMLHISPKDLDKVLYFAKYIVIDPGETPLEKYQIISDKEYDETVEKYDEGSFKAKMGAEGIKELLQEIDVEKLAAELREELQTAVGQKKAALLKRLEVVDAFRLSGNRPEWMILDVIPVIPPDIRPMVQLDGGRFATSDLNDLYRRVINRNNRLKKLLELGSPEIIIRNEKRMLQEAVDALIDNGRHGRAVTGPNNRPLKSLSDMLKGKQGRFRQNLLGKRVDYSGRSVIVVGPELKIYQCGLPKEMALELFKPFVMKRLVELNEATNIKNARKMVDRATPAVWDALEIVIKDHPVMLNRAPTLHRLGIQAFEPILVEGRAIKLHPLVCTAFNADFDGDQMAVHVPLSSEAQAEARFLMLAANNLLKPSDGKPVTVPTQDMVLGSYYLTTVRDDEPGTGHVYKDEDEAVMAYSEGDLGLHAPIKLRITKEVDGTTYTAITDTTLGKIIFNRPVPQNLGFVERNPEDAESMVKPEVDFLVDKKNLGKIIDRCISMHGTNVAATVLDNIKNQGYKFSTRSGITVSVFDAIIPEKKKEYVDAAQAKIDVIMSNYRRGRYSDSERSQAVIKVWTECTKKVSDELKKNLDMRNPIHMMIDSGARGSASQLNQLAGMRGLIANTAGQTIEIPIKANYREGLTVVEYFISSRGARKGLADTALRTADSGYLTRRLVDVSQEVIIREDDCGCTEGLVVSDILGDEDNVIEGLTERLTGRYLLHDLVDDNGQTVMDCNHMLSEDDAKKIVAAGFKKVPIRSLLTCDCVQGVCRKCYGKNLATGREVSIGEAVGIIAAQSIGEPGTQLTMRTFHTGGVTTTADITQGLPRVEELFEARRPKTLAILARIGGMVSFVEGKKGAQNILVSGEEGREEYTIPYGFRRTVQEGDIIEKGKELTEGSVDPHDILEVLGVEAVHNYLIREVQRTYRTQGVDVNDKHIEVIVRQMMRKVKIVEAGDTDLLPGSTVDKFDFKHANKEAHKKADENGTICIEATCEPVLLGITKAALATDSFLSAASFQETTRVLTDAAIKGKVDPLVGLKENVIIGKLLPSGTGMKCYNDVKVRHTHNEDTDIPDYAIVKTDEN